MRNGIYRLALFAVVMLLPQTALAYIGPGAGLSALGTLAALIGAVVLAIVGFVWYPVKRLLRGRKKTAPDPAAEDTAPGEP